MEAEPDFERRIMAQFTDEEALRKERAAMNVEPFPDRPRPSRILTNPFVIAFIVLIALCFVSAMFPGKYAERKRGEGIWETTSTTTPKSGVRWMLRH
jgi:hypothetical protein